MLLKTLKNLLKKIIKNQLDIKLRHFMEKDFI